MTYKYQIQPLIMKKSTFIIFVILCGCSLKPQNIELSENEISEKEVKEIAYLKSCFINKSKVVGFKEWILYEKNETIISLEETSSIIASKLVYFVLKNNGNAYLDKINFCRGSYQREIFIADENKSVKVNKESKLCTFTSNNRYSIYFCLINSDNLIIWVFSNGNKVYKNEFNVN